MSSNTFTDKEVQDIVDGYNTEITELQDKINNLKKRYPTVHKLDSADDFSDFMLDAENYEGDHIEYMGDRFRIDGIAEFIRDYTWDGYSQMSGDLDDVVANGLLVRVKR